MSSAAMKQERQPESFSSCDMMSGSSSLKAIAKQITEELWLPPMEEREATPISTREWSLSHSDESGPLPFPDLVTPLQGRWRLRPDETGASAWPQNFIIAGSLFFCEDGTSGWLRLRSVDNAVLLMGAELRTESDGAVLSRIGPTGLRTRFDWLE